MNGGLCNQLYQYIFARYIEEKTGDDVIIDDSVFFTKTIHNGFEIDKVFPNSKLKRLSTLFDEDVWDYMMQEIKNGNKIINLLNSCNLKFNVIIEDKTFINSNLLGEDNPFNTNSYNIPFDFILKNNGNPKEFKNMKNIYYAGYWINFPYFRAIQKEMDFELQFPPIPNEKNKNYLKKIESCFSIAVHVRRGDFLNEQFKWGLSAEYYNQTINKFKKDLLITPVEYFVFSDDIDWCKKNKTEMGFTSND